MLRPSCEHLQITRDCGQVKCAHALVKRAAACLNGESITRIVAQGAGQEVARKPLPLRTPSRRSRAWRHGLELAKVCRLTATSDTLCPPPLKIDPRCPQAP